MTRDQRKLGDKFALVDVLETTVSTETLPRH